MPIFLMVRLRGIEPPHPAPEAGALSTELQAHNALLIIAELNSQVKGQPLQRRQPGMRIKNPGP